MRQCAYAIACRVPTIRNRGSHSINSAVSHHLCACMCIVYVWGGGRECGCGVDVTLHCTCINLFTHLLWKNRIWMASVDYLHNLAPCPESNIVFSKRSCVYKPSQSSQLSFCVSPVFHFLNFVHAYVRTATYRYIYRLNYSGFWLATRMTTSVYSNAAEKRF